MSEYLTARIERAEEVYAEKKLAYADALRELMQAKEDVAMLHRVEKGLGEIAMSGGQQ